MVATLRKMIYWTIFICFAGYVNELIAAASVNQPQITQWVKITHDKLDTIGFSIESIENLEFSVISCGYKCDLVKLSTTPFSNQGILTVNVWQKNCSRRGGGSMLNLPFKVQNNVLITPIKNYDVLLSSEYCKMEFAKVTVSGDPYAETGYSIDLTSSPAVITGG